jgi:outer membrane beta-barrel protein
MKPNRLKDIFWIPALTLLALPLSISSHAAETGTGNGNSQNAASTLDNAGSEAERVNIENIKEKYWARGDENELGVVQNRLYTKARKFELGVFGGVISTDPFLSVKNAGGLLAYHFNEYFALSVMGYKSFSNPSSALELLQSPVGSGGLGTTANINNPNWFLGVEGAGSFLYGKLSLLGKAIIHFDMHLLAGVGETATVANTAAGAYNAHYVTPYIGIGQQIYLTKSMSLRLDYRLMRYNETIVEQVLPSKMGQPVGDRINYSNTITLGIDFLINPFGKKEETGAKQ